MSFAAQLGSFGKNALQETERVRRAVSIRLFSAVILDTPVDKGRLRANWQCSLKNPDATTTDSVDPSGSQVLSEMTRTINSAGQGDTFWLTNNLPYAARIEYDGWSHTKAPKGMVRINTARFARLIEKEARRRGL